MPVDDDILCCCLCPHDVDDHDERARCMTVTCCCGWGERVALGV